MAPDHEAVKTVGVVAAADCVIVGDGDAVGLLRSSASLYREEGSRTNSGKTARQREWTSSNRGRQKAGLLRESVNNLIVTEPNM